MKRNQGLFIRISDEEMNRLNSAWFDYVAKAGRPISKSEYIRRILSTFCDAVDLGKKEVNDGK